MPAGLSSGRKKQLKRGGDRNRVDFDHVELAVAERSIDLIALDEALTRLKEVSERGASVVEHRFFAGLSVDETATLLGVSSKTVQRDWITAKAWLRREVATGDL